MNEYHNKSNKCLSEGLGAALSMSTTVMETVKEYSMLEKGDVVVMGISGGPDSMCMLHVLNSLKEKYDLKLYAVHLNHQFRGADADGDAEYVREKCMEWGIPSHIEVFDVPKYIKETGLSSEEAGREIRYKLFNRIYDEVGGTKIAVAHNQNDNVETILMRFMRGTGIEGLKGIEPVRGNIIRPIIHVDRALIEEYCELHHINPRIDKTNYEPIYNRNKIRLDLLPYLRDTFNPNINSALTRFAELITEENDFLQKEAEERFKKVASIGKSSIKYNIQELNSEHIAMKRRVIRLGLEKLLGSLKGIEYKHIEGILSLLKEKTGASIVLPKNIKAAVSYDYLIIQEIYNKNDFKFCYELEYNHDNIFKENNITIEVHKKNINQISSIKKGTNEIFIDEEKIKDKLVYRNRNEGDIFSPIGMKGSKKLKNYFIDEKIPKDERDEIELLADGKEVVWVMGKRINEKYKITNTTSKVLEIKITKGIKDAE